MKKMFALLLTTTLLSTTVLAADHVCSGQYRKAGANEKFQVLSFYEEPGNGANDLGIRAGIQTASNRPNLDIAINGSKDLVDVNISIFEAKGGFPNVIAGLTAGRNSNGQIHYNGNVKGYQIVIDCGY